MTTRLLERRTELRTTVAALAQARAGRGTLIVVEGAPGLGRTALLDAVAALAAEQAVAVRRTAGSDLETDRPLALIRQAIPEAHWWSPGTNDATVDERILGHLASLAPVALLVDDADSADPESLCFIHYAVRRFDRLGLAVVLTWARRPQRSPGALLHRLATERAAQCLRLEPLTAEGSLRLARRHARNIDEELGRALHENAGGNPMLVTELARAGSAHAVPQPVVERVGVALERAGDEAAAVAHAAAVIGPQATLGQAAELAALELGLTLAGADRLTAVGLLAEAEPLRFRAPLVARGVLATLPIGRLGGLRLEAARVLARDGASAEQVAMQLLEAPRAGDTWVVERLLEGARSASERAAHGDAVAFLRRALEEPPAPALRARLTLELADAEALSGSLGALDRYHDALRLTSRPEELGRALVSLGWRLYQAGRPVDAQRAFARAATEVGEGNELAHEIEIASHALGAFDGSWNITDMRALLNAARTGEGGRGLGAIDLALASVFTDDDAERAHAAASEAMRALGGAPGTGLELMVASFALSALIWSDALEEAEAVIAAALGDARASGGPMEIAYLRFGRSWPRYWRAEVAAAAEDVAEAVGAWTGQWSFQLPSAVWWSARCLTELGRVDEAGAVIALAASGGPWPTDVQRGYLAAGFGHVALARRDYDGAWQHLSELEQMDLPWFRSTTIIGWHADAVVALERSGRSDRARELADDYLAAARRFGAPRSLGSALRTRATIEGGDAALPLAAEAVEVLERSPSLIELIRALVDQGALLRSRGRRSEARAALRRALALANDTTALVLRERARAELRMAGGRLHREEHTGIGSLTAAERRVVDLAASGKKNSEIAGELFISRKTVEYHLANAYRKLGVSSRTQLAAAVDDV